MQKQGGGGGRPKCEVTRRRFSIPNADAKVIDWCDCQASLSGSLRVIIKEAIAKYGYADCTCITEASAFAPVQTEKAVPERKLAPVINTAGDDNDYAAALASLMA